MGERVKVALVPCADYDRAEVKEKLRIGFDLLGGVRACVGEAARPLLKPNLLRGATPEKAVTTHPAVLLGVTELLIEEGYADITCGDSAGFGAAEKILRELGAADELQAKGVRLSSFDTSEAVDFPEGIHAKSFTIAKDVLDADAILSLSKFKTHALEHITGAVKNQYGCVQGLHKAKGHTMYPSRESFARMLIDLNLFLKPRFYVMDGVVGMEGNGPASGDPVEMGVLLFSDYPVALDTVVCQLMYVDPAIIPTCEYGAKMGLGTMSEEEIEIITPEGTITFAEAQARFGKPDFDVIRKRDRVRGIMGAATLLRVFQKKPRIDASLCRKCGICVESCPVEGKAVDFKKGRDKPPVYTYRKCIRCFCCQEMCPYKAITVK